MIVFTAGTFDLFHVGHLILLQACRKLAGKGGGVVASVNSSEFVERFKGAAPTQSTEERFRMVQACRYVDEVVVNEHENLTPLLSSKSPDFLVIGSDWAPPRDYHAQIGATPQWLADKEITLLFLDRSTPYSSTELKKRISHG